MEKVFWLMWLADIVGSIGFVGATSMVFFGMGMVIVAILAAVEGEPSFLARGFKVARWLLLPVIVACLAPNSKTIHILAAASAAEAVATTHLGAKSLEALNAVLDTVIDKAKKD